MLPREALLYVAFGLYCLNLLVGLVAQLRLFRFGKAHHILYFVVFAFAVAALVFTFHPALLLTIAALGFMPKSRPWTRMHLVCAGVGFLGYALTLFSRLFF